MSPIGDTIKIIYKVPEGNTTKDAIWVMESSCRPPLIPSTEFDISESISHKQVIFHLCFTKIAQKLKQFVRFD